MNTPPPVDVITVPAATDNAANSTAARLAPRTSQPLPEDRGLRSRTPVTADGTVYGGAQAVAKLLSSARGGWAVAGAVLQLAPARWLAHGIYRAIAHNRHRLPGSTSACSSPTDRRPGKS
ncbi:thiol-disulfide oxidoreductase DCC family protein [Streptomyces sp. NPDC058145]|uniref:thiol-disulfide oxidoreductase DCC family protein n=1 Tax=Streptomyces sp. NPDC058145 TaxID=3346356 RepID=UPI0036ECED9F